MARKKTILIVDDHPLIVENYRYNIMNKLGLHSTLELVHYAARLGLIDVDLWKE